ncbi:MAG: DUF2399 domain-containing protein [Halothiobacillaceae bacterium]
MDPIAHKALSKLLVSAERHRLKNAGGPEPSLRFSTSSFPAYLRLESVDAMEEVHASLREAQRFGAIEIEWDARAGEQGAIKRIKVTDDEALADLLGETPYWCALESAEKALRPWSASDGVSQLLDAWREMRRPRGITPGQLDDVLDGLRVLEEMRGEYEIPVRRLGARVFADSKRIEALVPVLDVLTRENDDPARREPEEILRKIGLVKHRQPLLIAGGGGLLLQDGDGAGFEMPMPYPYVGVEPQTVRRLSNPACVSNVLTVENLTTFHELARLMKGCNRGVLLYTGGFPSPAFLLAYRALVRDLPERTTFWHWGDIDRGGLRIAKTVADTLQEEGRELRSWRMNPDELPREQLYLRDPDGVIEEMVGTATDIGWSDLADGLERVPCTVEQEALAPVLPAGFCDMGE